MDSSKKSRACNENVLILWGLLKVALDHRNSSIRKRKNKNNFFSSFS